MKRLLIIIAASLVVSTAFAQFNKNFPLLKKNSWATSISKAKAPLLKTRSPAAIQQAIQPLGVRDPDTLTTPPRRCEIVPGVSTITTFAGTGGTSEPRYGGGFSGDDGPAISAGMIPGRIDFDVDGNLYITDTLYGEIRRVDKSGRITTVAGNGTRGFSGDGGLATSAELGTPYSVAVDADENLYIADNFNSRIRRVDSTSGVITTFAPAVGPFGVTVDAHGNLYITQSAVIQRVDTSGRIRTVAGNGHGGGAEVEDGELATSGRMGSNHAVVFDADENFYVATDNRIRRVDLSGIITTVAGTGTQGFSGDGGPATAAELSSPTDVAFDAIGNLYIADQSNNRIRKVTCVNE